MRISDWSSDVCSSDLFNNHGILPNTLLFKGLVIGGEIKTYPNLYTREVYDKTTDEMKEELGFYTDVKTRPLIIDELRQAVREEVILLNDATTIDEMITFVADPKSGKIEAEVGCHDDRSEEHTSELQSLMRISSAVFCLKKKHLPPPCHYCRTRPPVQAGFPDSDASSPT